MFSNIGIPGLVIILVIALIIFGPSKPEVGRAFGRTLTEFKGAAKGLVSDDEGVKEKQARTVSEQKENESTSTL